MILLSLVAFWFCCFGVWFFLRIPSIILSRKEPGVPHTHCSASHSTDYVCYKLLNIEILLFTSKTVYFFSFFPLNLFFSEKKNMLKLAS